MLQTDSARRPALLLVHGAWHGAWCWEDLIPPLSARGWRTWTVDLPSGLDVGDAAPSHVPGLYDDAATIARALAEIAEPTIVVAHSYGGAPSTEAAAVADNLIHVIYLAAFALDVGESVRTSMGADPDLPVPLSGYSAPMSAAELYSDVDPQTAARASRRLRLQSDPSRAQPVRRAGWHDVESTYVVCDADAAIPPSRQEEFASRAGSIRHLATGHSPFYSAPHALADLITDVAGSAS